MVLELTREAARRVAVRAQLLDLPRPNDLMEVARHLAAIQVDLTAHVAPSADLVLWSRLGEAYEPAQLDEALDAGALIELEGFLRPGEDLALFRAEMASWRGDEPMRVPWQEAVRAWGHANRAATDALVEALRRDGPLPAADLPDETVVPWRSSGWNNRKNVQMLLSVLERSGEVAVAGRADGGGRLWDLARRVWPETPVLEMAEALAIRDRRRLRSLGIARPTTTSTPVEPNHVGTAGVDAVVEGVRGRWRIDPNHVALIDEPIQGRTALLSPLDRLVFDRKRMTDLFDFDYALEMYKPASQRRWGYWALPILSGDSLIGKVDAAADHRTGRLVVSAVHLDGPVPLSVRHEVDREIDALAAWLGLVAHR
jgi:uncharacterized protein YcaQ